MTNGQLFGLGPTSCLKACRRIGPSTSSAKDNELPVHELSNG